MNGEQEPHLHTSSPNSYIWSLGWVPHLQRILLYQVMFIQLLPKPLRPWSLKRGQLLSTGTAHRGRMTQGQSCSLCKLLRSFSILSPPGRKVPYSQCLERYPWPRCPLLVFIILHICTNTTNSNNLKTDATFWSMFLITIFLFCLDEFFKKIQY